MKPARILVSTARKWQYERSRMQQNRLLKTFPYALIDEAYQMRSDMLLGIADLYDTLFCVGDPGQLDPFSTVDDGLWKGLPYAPTRTAMGTLRQFHPELEPMQLPTSWRLPPSAAGIVAEAFYPFAGFVAGTIDGDRALALGRKLRGAAPHPNVDVDGALQSAATSGWAYIELPEKFTVRTDGDIAGVLAAVVVRLLSRSADVSDERNREGKASSRGSHCGRRGPQ